MKFNFFFLTKIGRADEELSNLTSAILKLDNRTPKKSDQYHWMVYPQEEMPSYIIEAKKRLGIIKQPHIVPNQASKQPDAPPKIEILTEPKQAEPDNYSEAAKKPIVKHWLNWDNPSTPDKIKDIRARLGDDRYRKNYQNKLEQRSKTVLEIYNGKTDDSDNLVALNRSKTAIETRHQEPSVCITNTVTINDEPAPVFVESKPAEVLIIKESASTPAALTTTEVMFSSDQKPKVAVSHAPYNDTLELVRRATSRCKSNLSLSAVANNYFDQPGNGAANANPSLTVNQLINQIDDSTRNQADNDYMKSFDAGNNDFLEIGNQANQFDYASPVKQLQSKASYTIADNANTAMPLEAWISQANENDRHAIIRILKNLDEGKSTGRSGADSRLSNKYVRVKVKNASNPNLRRSVTPQIRKLGTTRHLYKFPSEKNEKLLIKQHLWNNE